MRHFCSLKEMILVFIAVLINSALFSQPISYTFSAFSGTYTANPVPPTSTDISEIYFGADDELSGAYPIGFNFTFGSTVYSQFKVSSNGWLTFNLGANSPTEAQATNALSSDAIMRPGIAPLWDDIGFNSQSQSVTSHITGSSPNRIRTIEWKRANWRFVAASAGISFQVKLYEGINRIDFVYFQEPGALSASPTASIGLAGPTLGDYYSLNNSSASPTPSKVVNTTTINTKPATNQVYRWELTGPLPIMLTAFSGSKENGKNVLHWTTSSEENNACFVVERSYDGIHFTELSRLSGANNSNEELHYTYTDNDWTNLIAYYRLRQIDFDGASTCSETISVLPDPTNSITIYPNPAKDEITVETVKGDHTYKLYNHAGMLVLTGAIEGSSAHIDLSLLSAGTYYLSIDQQFRKIIVE